MYKSKVKTKTQENCPEKINVLLSKELNNTKRISGVFSEIIWELLLTLKEFTGHFYLTWMYWIDCGYCIIHQPKGFG